MQLKNLLSLALGATVSARSLTEVLASQSSDLSLLTGLITSSPALVKQLTSAKNITILAPSNGALGAFLNNSATTAATSADANLVAALLTYHVLNGTYNASAFTETVQFLPSLLSNETYTNVTGGQVVGGKTVGNGVVLYSGLLQTSNVTKGDLAFDGGVIHIIDTVLTIPASDSATAGAANLTALAGALTATDLVSTVDGLADVTIFAPSNAAFASIASAAGNISTEALAGILQYHVVQGTVGYSSLLSNTTLETVGGGNVTISIIDGSVYVNSAKVIAADVLVANGVVHVIDGVLNPANSTVVPNPSTTVPAFEGASTASDGSTPFTSGVTGSTTITNAPTATDQPGGGAATSLSSQAGAAMPTGAIGMGAMFGGALLFAAGL